MLVRLLPENAESPMAVTLLGMDTLVMLNANAELPIATLESRYERQV